MPKLIDYNFQTKPALTGHTGPDLTITRATTATYRDSSGVLQTAATGEARFHKTDGSTTSEGLLVEGSITNLQTFSALTSANWVKYSINVTEGAITGPDGLTSGVYLEDTGGGGVATIMYERSTGGLAAASRYTCSVWAKAGDHSMILLDPSRLLSDVNAGVYFDLSDGSTGAAAVDAVAYGSEAWPNGWYRCWVTYDTVSDTTGGMSIYLTNDLTSSVLCERDGTSNIYVFGAQQEKSKYMTSYIPATGSSSVTKNEDVVTTGYTDLTGYLSTSGDHTIYAKYYWIGWPQNVDVGGIWSTIGAVDGGASTYSELIRTRSGGTGTIQCRADTNSGQATGLTQRTPATGVLEKQVQRIANGVAYNDMSTWIDGGNNATDATVDYSPNSGVFDHSSVELELGVQHTDAHILRIAYWDERLSDADMTTYTTSGLPLAFPGTIAGDGGVMWPPRANDPRWTQLITDSGISASGNFMDDVKKALLAMSGASNGSLDDLWKKTLAANSITDISEPYLY